jgi:hypothetical protein
MFCLLTSQIFITRSILTAFSYVGARSARTIMAFSIGLGATGEYVLPAGIVPFLRGFAFVRDGTSSYCLPDSEDSAAWT